VLGVIILSLALTASWWLPALKLALTGSEADFAFSSALPILGLGKGIGLYLLLGMCAQPRGVSTSELHLQAEKVITEPPRQIKERLYKKLDLASRLVDAGFPSRARRLLIAVTADCKKMIEAAKSKSRLASVAELAKLADEILAKVEDIVDEAGIEMPEGADETQEKEVSAGNSALSDERVALLRQLGESESSVAMITERIDKHNYDAAIGIYLLYPNNFNLNCLKEACRKDLSVTLELLSALENRKEFERELPREGSIAKIEDLEHKLRRAGIGVVANQRAKASPRTLLAIVRLKAFYVHNYLDIPKGEYEKSSYPKDAELFHASWNNGREKIFSFHHKETEVRFSFTSTKALIKKRPYLACRLGEDNRLVLKARELNAEKETTYWLICDEAPYLREIEASPRLFIRWLVKERKYKDPQVVRLLASLPYSKRPRYALKGERHTHACWAQGNKIMQITNDIPDQTRRAEYTLLTASEVQQRIPVVKDERLQEEQLVLMAETRHTFGFYFFTDVGNHINFIGRLIKATGEMQRDHHAKLGPVAEILEFIKRGVFDNPGQPPMTPESFPFVFNRDGFVYLGSFVLRKGGKPHNIYLYHGKQIKKGTAVEIRRVFSRKDSAGSRGQWLLETQPQGGGVYRFYFFKYGIRGQHLAVVGRWVAELKANGQHNLSSAAPRAPEVGRSIVIGNTHPGVTAFILKKLNLRGDEKICDIGSNRGDFCLAAAEVYPATQITGIELERESFEESLRCQEEAGVANVEFINCDALSEEIDYSQFDVIYMYFPITCDLGFYHSLAKRLASQMKPGARFVCFRVQKCSGEEMRRIKNYLKGSLTKLVYQRKFSCDSFVLPKVGASWRFCSPHMGEVYTKLAELALHKEPAFAPETPLNRGMCPDKPDAAPKGTVSSPATPRTKPTRRTKGDSFSQFAVILGIICFSLALTAPWWLPALKLILAGIGTAIAVLAPPVSFKLLAAGAMMGTMVENSNSAGSFKTDLKKGEQFKVPGHNVWITFLGKVTLQDEDTLEFYAPEYIIAYGTEKNYIGRGTRPFGKSVRVGWPMLCYVPDYAPKIKKSFVMTVEDIDEAAETVSIIFEGAYESEPCLRSDETDENKAGVWGVPAGRVDLEPNLKKLDSDDETEQQSAMKEILSVGEWIVPRLQEETRKTEEALKEEIGGKARVYKIEQLTKFRASLLKLLRCFAMQTCIMQYLLEKKRDDIINAILENILSVLRHKLSADLWSFFLSIGVSKTIEGRDYILFDVDCKSQTKLADIFDAMDKHLYHKRLYLGAAPLLTPSDFRKIKLELSGCRDEVQNQLLGMVLGHMDKPDDGRLECNMGFLGKDWPVTVGKEFREAAGCWLIRVDTGHPAYGTVYYEVSAKKTLRRFKEVQSAPSPATTALPNKDTK
jgi:precorrin-6B methylase 2